MSLQIWLPFNGSLVNQGVYNSTITSTSPQYSTSGKIGKALSLASNGNYTVKTTYTQNNNEMSICFWVNPNNPGIWTDIFSFGGNNRMEVSSDDKKSYTWYVDSGKQGLISSGTYLFGLNLSTWSHVSIIIDTSSVYFYVNGTLTKTVSRLSTTLANIFAENAFFYVGARVANNYCYSGLINDFRVYDECLSPKQVKEISKGLVCHYPLDNNGSGMPNLLKNTNKGISGWGWSSSGGSRTTTALSDGIGVRLESVTAGSSWSVLGYQDGNLKNTIVAGKSYVVSVDCRCSYAVTLNCTILDGNGQNSMTNNVSANRATVAGQWVHLVWKLTANSSFTVSSQEIYITNASLTAGTYFEFKNIKMEEGTTDTPWCPNSTDALYSIFNINSNKEIDTSGYGNHGTKVGLTYSSDTPRYSVCSLFGSNRGIYCSTTTIPRVDGEPITVSCWFKQIGRSGYQDIVANRGSTSSDNFNWLLYTHTTDGSIQFHGSAQNKSTIIPTLNEWHHVVAVVYANSTYSLFLDGSKVVNAASYTYRVKTAQPLVIGKYGTESSYAEVFNGYISDVRIYATALSDEDALDLYKTRASIDNKGNILAYDFQE